ncbi:MAG: DUF1573 domain-containing protein [Desulfobacteraceae bacterium]|nr:DUF1573 domain-containing protein [Desulfobacteraceae bacterium]MBC2757634.1 DUF1573 domain-containing protein [Desulfobacteraceae bacterium]MBC2763879.1 DUF1573 domain-containing protein [ANME-2 cluster archaeon]
MRKRFCLMLLIVSLSIISFLAPSLADEGVPVAVIENASFDFGTIYEGVDVIHDFKIQNKGDADLEIIDVKAG